MKHRQNIKKKLYTQKCNVIIRIGMRCGAEINQNNTKI